MARFLGNNADFASGVDANSGEPTWRASFSGDGRGETGTGPLYPATKDYDMEFGLHNACTMYENVNVFPELNYIALWADHFRKVRGRSATNGKDGTVMVP